MIYKVNSEMTKNTFRYRKMIKRNCNQTVTRVHLIPNHRLWSSK